MKILNSITMKNLKFNKKRTIVTIIGIMLSVALICAITSFVVSFQNAMLNREIKRGGNYHVRVSNVTEENRKYIENNINVEKIGYEKEIGYGIIANNNEKVEETQKPQTDNKETQEEANKTQNPQTGDNVLAFGIIFVVAVLGLAISTIISKKNKNIKKKNK